MGAQRIRIAGARQPAKARRRKRRVADNLNLHAP